MGRFITVPLLKRSFMKKHITIFWPMILITIIYGLIFGLITNRIFEKLLQAIWTPLAIAILFLVFLVLLLVIIYITSRICKSRTEVTKYFKNSVIFVLIFFIAAGVFECIYEIDTKVDYVEPDSYVFVVDDSGSMSANDENELRLSAIDDLLKNKSDSFPYSIYVFASDVEQKRGMLQKSSGESDIDLLSDGGTAILGSLDKILEDINSNSLKTYNATRLILLSDGYGDTSSLDPSLSKTLKKYAEKNISISTVGLGNSVDESTMKKIAYDTNGVYVQVDNATDLDTAFAQASVGTSNRNILGYRGYCHSDILHAIMRIVFLFLLAAAINILKFYTYGKYYKIQIPISIITSLLAPIFMEISLNLFSFGENATRIVFWIMLALMIIEKVNSIFVKRSIDDEPLDDGIEPIRAPKDDPDTSEIDKKGREKFPETKGLL